MKIAASQCRPPCRGTKNILPLLNLNDRTPILTPGLDEVEMPAEDSAGGAAARKRAQIPIARVYEHMVSARENPPPETARYRLGASVVCRRSLSC